MKSGDLLEEKKTKKKTITYRINIVKKKKKKHNTLDLTDVSF